MCSRICLLIHQLYKTGPKVNLITKRHHTKVVLTLKQYFYLICDCSCRSSIIKKLSKQKCFAEIWNEFATEIVKMAIKRLTGENADMFWKPVLRLVSNGFLLFASLLPSEIAHSRLLKPFRRLLNLFAGLKVWLVEKGILKFFYFGKG